MRACLEMRSAPAIVQLWGCVLDFESWSSGDDVPPTRRIFWMGPLTGMPTAPGRWLRSAASSGLTPYLWAFLSALILSWVSLWNASPIVYEDTSTYLARPATLIAKVSPEWASIWAETHKVERLNGGQTSEVVGNASPGFDGRVKGGRSIYYGAVALGLHALGGLLLVAVFQAYLLGACVSLLCYRALPGPSLPALLAISGLLALSTSAGFFVNVIMPDVLSGLLILALGMLAAFWDRFLTVDRLFLSLVAVFAAISHDSNLLIAGGLSLCLFGAALVWRGRRGALVRSGRVGLAVVAAGSAAALAFEHGVERATGFSPTRLPHLTAHVVSLPAGRAYLDENCKLKGWAVCAYAERFPMVWTDFLFGREPSATAFATAPTDIKLTIAEQDLALAADFVRTNPGAATFEMARASLQQAISFSYVDFQQAKKQRYLRENFPPEVLDRLMRARLWRQPQALFTLSAIHQWTVGLSILLLPIALWGAYRAGAAQTAPLMILTAVLVTGVLGNAVVCGVLASPYDRFQARVIWLIPLALFSAAAFALQLRRSPADVELAARA
jgi:hypothetical protein